MGRPADLICSVRENTQVLPGVHSITFDCPAPLTDALPGQFVQVEASEGTFPVTRRPFTVNRKVEGGLEILFDVVGGGTSLLAGSPSGAGIRVLGPLGSGWSTGRGGRWLLVGGGLGAAGFPYLASVVDCAAVLIGASSSERVIPMDPGCEILVATEDGSTGKKGLVTDLFSENTFRDVDVIAVCGPVPMMEAVWMAIPEPDRGKVQVSTESRMGCGWGVCDGCSIPAAGGGYRKCCVDGPVFDGLEIDWKRWKEAGL